MNSAIPNYGWEVVNLSRITETVSHFLLDCPRHTTLRQQLFFSLLDIPQTISLNLLIFGSVNLNDEEKVVVLESCDADNLIRNEIQFQLFHRYNLAIQQGF
jgi:hypothetical protein